MPYEQRKFKDQDKIHFLCYFSPDGLGRKEMINPVNRQTDERFYDDKICKVFDKRNLSIETHSVPALEATHTHTLWMCLATHLTPNITVTLPSIKIQIRNWRVMKMLYFVRIRWKTEKNESNYKVAVIVHVWTKGRRGRAEGTKQYIRSKVVNIACDNFVCLLEYIAEESTEI